jgi:protein gp37
VTKRAGEMARYVQRRAVDEQCGAIEHRAKQLLGWMHEPIPIGKTLAGTWPWPHVWFGASAERQREFDERWPPLRRLAELGSVVFISYEPAMGPFKLPPDFLALRDRAWLIAGGCSGERAWPAHPDWFRAVRDQCAGAGVPFFFKQWGEYAPATGEHGPRSLMARIGKKAAGALLDGVSHRAFPRAGAAIGAAA